MSIHVAVASGAMVSAWPEGGCPQANGGAGYVSVPTNASTALSEGWCVNQDGDMTACQGVVSPSNTWGVWAMQTPPLATGPQPLHVLYTRIGGCNSNEPAFVVNEGSPTSSCGVIRSATGTIYSGMDPSGQLTRVLSSPTAGFIVQPRADTSLGGRTTQGGVCAQAPNPVAPPFGSEWGHPTCSGLQQDATLLIGTTSRGAPAWTAWVIVVFLIGVACMFMTIVLWCVPRSCAWVSSGWRDARRRLFERNNN
jgi:hypothetical protein